MFGLENWPAYYWLIALAVLLLAWFFAPSFRRRHAKDELAPEPDLFLLLSADDGRPYFQRVKRDKQGHLVGPDKTVYPAEFLLPMGRNNYFVATHCSVPSDGDMAHGGDWPELVEVRQPVFLAHWADYDRARRGLNWASIWVPGDGSAAMVRNLATAALCVLALWGVWNTWGVASEVSRLADSIPRMQAQIEVIGGVSADSKEVIKQLRDPAPVDPGASAGDAP